MRGRGGRVPLSRDGKQRGPAGPSPRRPPSPRVQNLAPAGLVPSGQCHRRQAQAPPPPRRQRWLMGFCPQGQLEVWIPPPPSKIQACRWAPSCSLSEKDGPAHRDSEHALHSVLRPAFDSARCILLTGVFQLLLEALGPQVAPQGRRTRPWTCLGARSRSARCVKGRALRGAPPLLCLTHHATLNQLQIKLSRREIICFKHKRFFFSGSLR